MKKTVKVQDVLKLCLSQNIKKREAGGAKPRGMAGGLLPPPPGVKVGGVTPPPVGQPPVLAVQTNTGNNRSII